MWCRRRCSYMPETEKDLKGVSMQSIIIQRNINNSIEGEERETWKTSHQLNASSRYHRHPLDTFFSFFHSNVYNKKKGESFIYIYIKKYPPSLSLWCLSRAIIRHYSHSGCRCGGEKEQEQLLLGFLSSSAERWSRDWSRGQQSPLISIISSSFSMEAKRLCSLPKEEENIYKYI